MNKLIYILLVFMFLLGGCSHLKVTTNKCVYPETPNQLFPNKGDALQDKMRKAKYNKILTDGFIKDVETLKNEK